MDIEDIIIYTTKPCFMTMATMGYFSMIHILSKYMKGQKAYSLKFISICSVIVRRSIVRILF